MKTVNFIEAVNSGKRFKGLNDDHWFDYEDDDPIIVTRKYINQDFILEEKTITITESGFDAAYSRSVTDSLHAERVDGRSAILICGRLKKELGF